MPFPRNTWFDHELIFNDIRIHMINPQYSVPMNASEWKKWAVTKDRPVERISQAMMQSVITDRKDIADVEKYLAPGDRRTRVMEAMARHGATEKDITDITTPLKAQLIALERAPKSTYAEIIKECDRILAEFSTPERIFD